MVGQAFTLSVSNGSRLARAVTAETCPPQADGCPTIRKPLNLPTFPAEQTANPQVMNMVAQRLPLRLRSGQALFTPLALFTPSGVEGSLSNGSTGEGSLPVLSNVEGLKDL